MERPRYVLVCIKWQFFIGGNLGLLVWCFYCSGDIFGANDLLPANAIKCTSEMTETSIQLTNESGAIRSNIGVRC